MGLIKLIIGLAFLGLFSIAVISYVTQFADDNEVGVDLNDDPMLSTVDTNLRGGFDTFVTSSNSSSDILESSEIKSGDENVEGGGQFKVVRKDMYDNTKQIFALTNSKVFGGDVSFAVVTTAIASLLLTIFGLYVWKTWKGGNPD